jgi:hypothetical protein
MPRKKKKLKKFTATTAVKSMSRAVIGKVPAVKRKESKKAVDKPKHKPTLKKILADSDSI